MRLQAAMVGDLRKMMQQEVKVAARAITQTVDEASTGLLSDLRRDTAQALGGRVANAWRRKKYPGGRDSMAAAGWVYSKAPNIINAFSRSQVIRAASGLWLAIPGPGCPPRIGRKRPTPALVEQHFKRPLKFVYRPGKPALLVMPSVTASYSRKTGALRGFRGLTEKRAASGRDGATAIMFYLVPAIRTPRLLDLDAKISAWGGRMPALLVSNWDRLTKADFIRLGD